MKIPGRKRTAGVPIEPCAPPPFVRVPLGGCTPVVKPGAAVAAGEVIARDAHGLQRHSPLTGRVEAVTAGAVTVRGRLAAPRVALPGDLDAAARAAGVVGLGGGEYPTWRKLERGRPIHAVLINGCESEPYVTGDHRVLTEHGAEVRAGLELARAFTGAAGGRIVTTDRGYPGGYERLLAAAALGRPLPPERRPSDAGVLVLNVQTAAALYHAAAGRPLVSRVVTVDGGAVGRPGNYRVPIGTPVSHLVAACAVDLARAAAIVVGGPMMGHPATPESVVRPGTIAVLALTAAEVAAPPPEPCIRCGACAAACPMGLRPSVLLRGPADALHRCMGCGACQYACPAGRPLVEQLQRAKRAAE